MDILINNNFTIGTSSACLVDLTPPTFSGITSLDVETRGQIRTMWAAASDATSPIRYEIYIQSSTATGLFNTTNIVAVTPNLLYDIFTMPDGSFLVNGDTYYVGVRAIDGVSNRDSNTVSMNVISTGVLTSIDVYDVDGAFSLADGGDFQGTIWAKKNSELCLSSNCSLGTASYAVYDKSGAAVSGLTQSGIVADANGQFKITAVAADLDETLNHYVVKVSVSVDSEIRTDYVPIVQKIPSYRVNGHNGFNDNNEFVGVFWAEDESHVQISNPARLGAGSYDVLDTNGDVISGFSESGITPNAQGVYVITPVSGVNPANIFVNTGRVTIEIDGKNRTTYIPVNVKTIDHEVKAVFSINALNQLQATFWVMSTDGTVKTTGIGNANYTVYDKDGVAVVGLTESGISADVNGRYKTTAVSAALLTDLTHYTVKVGIIVQGEEHISYKGFTLLGN